MLYSKENAVLEKNDKPQTGQYFLTKGMAMWMQKT